MSPLSLYVCIISDNCSGLILRWVVRYCARLVADVNTMHVIEQTYNIVTMGA